VAVVNIKHEFHNCRECPFSREGENATGSGMSKEKVPYCIKGYFGYKEETNKRSYPYNNHVYIWQNEYFNDYPKYPPRICEYFDTSYEEDMAQELGIAVDKLKFLLEKYNLVRKEDDSDEIDESYDKKYGYRYLYFRKTKKLLVDKVKCYDDKKRYYYAEAVQGDDDIDNIREWKIYLDRESIGISITGSYNDVVKKLVELNKESNKE
jgi:hypothetical protein